MFQTSVQVGAVGLLIWALFLVRGLQREVTRLRMSAKMERAHGRARKALRRMENTGNRMFNLLAESGLNARRQIEDDGYGIVVNAPKIHIHIDTSCCIRLTDGKQNWIFYPETENFWERAADRITELAASQRGGAR